MSETLEAYLARCGKRQHTTEVIVLGPWERTAGPGDPYALTPSALGGSTPNHGRSEPLAGIERLFVSLEN